MDLKSKIQLQNQNIPLLESSINSSNSSNHDIPKQELKCDELLAQLIKTRSAISIGVNYSDFNKMLIDLDTAYNIYSSSCSASVNPKIKEALILLNYSKNLWKLKITPKNDLIMQSLSIESALGFVKADRVDKELTLKLKEISNNSIIMIDVEYIDPEKGVPAFIGAAQQLIEDSILFIENQR